MKYILCLKKFKALTTKDKTIANANLDFQGQEKFNFLYINSKLK